MSARSAGSVSIRRWLTINERTSHGSRPQKRLVEIAAERSSGICAEAIDRPRRAKCWTMLAHRIARDVQVLDQLIGSAGGRRNCGSCSTRFSAGFQRGGAEAGFKALGDAARRAQETEWRAGKLAAAELDR